jgi:hypothetical protein
VLGIGWLAEPQLPSGPHEPDEQWMVGPNMANVTSIVGVLLLLIGVGGYVVTEGAHITALLPAALGLVILILGIVAGRIEAGQHAIHAALALALLGGLGALPRAFGVADGGAAAIASLLTVIVVVVYVGLGVRSFIAARKARQQA